MNRFCDYAKEVSDYTLPHLREVGEYAGGAYDFARSFVEKKRRKVKKKIFLYRVKRVLETTEHIILLIAALIGLGISIFELLKSLDLLKRSGKKNG